MDFWTAKNRRRIQLIEKKYGESLTDGEAEELARLKREVAAHMKVVAPRSTEVLDEISDFVARMRAKVAARNENRPRLNSEREEG